MQGHGESVDFTVRTIAQLSGSGLALSATTLTAQVRRTSVLTLLLLCIYIIYLTILIIGIMHTTIYTNVYLL